VLATLPPGPRKCQCTTAITVENLSPNICGLRAVLPMKVEAGAQAMAVDRKTKSTNNFTNQGEFLHKYYTFQSARLIQRP